MIVIKLKHVYEDTDRHGNVRIYFWRRGQRKVRIRETPGTPAFIDRYHQLVASLNQPKGAPEIITPTLLANTYRWLCVLYFGSSAFKALHSSTQASRRRVLESTLTEPLHPGSPEVYANFPLARITTKSLRVLRDRKADLPGAASDRVKAIRAVFAWAMDEEYVASNPARDLSKLRMPGSGFHSWTQEEVEQFKRRHPLGTKSHLALSLLLWTGVRRSDAVLLGRQHARDGWFKFTVSKNIRRKPIRIEIPVLPELQSVLDVSPCGDMTYLVTTHGRPFTAAGFGNWFRDRCNEAGLSHCSAHGLRKAGAATAAENGATTQQLMAVFGWLSLAEAERYTRAAEKARLARAAMPLLVKLDK